MKRTIIIFILTFLITAPVIAQIPEQATFTYLKDAFSNRDSDIVEYLIDECNRYLQTNWDSPNADEVLFMLGNMYEEDGEYPRALLAYLKIKFIYPDSDRRNEAISNLNQIVHNKAESTFREKRKEIDELVSQSLSFTDRNNAYYDFLDFVHELNIEDLNEILIDQINFYILIYPNNAKNADQLYFWIGDIFRKLSKWNESILAYNKVQYIAPESILIPRALFQIGYLQYEETGKYEKAKETFVKLIAAHPEIPIAGDAQYYLAELYEQEFDNMEEAVSNYRVLVETYPDSRFAVESLKRVAEIMEDKDNYEEAIASYYQIFELYPKNNYAPEALLEIESLYRKQLDNYEKAIEVLKLYTDQFPDKDDAAEQLFEAGEIYNDDLNDKKAAIDTYHEVINKFPGSSYAERAKDRIEDLSEEN
jgi:TolA-binding protein